MRAALAAEFDALVDTLAAVPIAVMHRDFQSHNIMVTRGGEAVVDADAVSTEDGTLHLLDFQDAMLGPIVYDAVAFLRDSYVVLTPSELSELVDQFAASVATMAAAGGADAESITRWFHLQTVQRKLKDAGRFVYIDRVKKNSSFLQYIPSSLSYVRNALSLLPELSRLWELLAQVDPALAEAP